jgi:hypothetical protein
MFRLRTAIVLTASVATLGSGLSVSPAAGADAVAACDPALGPALTWSAPSFLAWGREARVGANVADASEGPVYADNSIAFAVDAGSSAASPSPVDNDFEFVVKAPARGAAVTASATWSLVDETGTTRCAQTTALTVPLGAGKILRYAARRQSNGIAWSAIGAGDCHDVALERISLTVQQGALTRRLTAADQCNPAGTSRVSTPDWELALKNGRFEVHVLAAHSSLKARLRYALRVGSRRVASGSLSLVRKYRPYELIRPGNPKFMHVCVHGLYHWVNDGSRQGCEVPGIMQTHIALV